MAGQHGGYRKPTNPAPVSGPGALSRRTDGQPTMDLPNARYGEAQAFREAQQAAPLANSGGPQATTPAGGSQAPALTPLNAPTERPDEPITAGAPVGAGVGPEALGLPTEQSEQDADLERLRPLLPLLIERANDPNSSDSFRRYVRAVRAGLMKAS